jgi:hypothetical protein
VSEATSTSAPDVSRATQNLAVLCRTALVGLAAWIALRLTWPGEFWESRLTELTVGNLLIGIFWLIVSLALAAMFFGFGLNLPARTKQTDFWCHWWLGWAATIGCSYALAFVLLTKPAKGGITGVFQGLATLMCWLIVRGDQHQLADSRDHIG